MIRYIILILSARVLFATTHTAASASYADVNTARALCAAGDTLSIPAGTNDWSSSVLTVTKAITISGAGTNFAGTDCTFIYGAATSSGLIDWKIDSDAALRLTGCVFSNSAAQPTVKFRGTNVSGGNFKMTSLRIDRCLFLKGKRAIWALGWVYGLVDQNTFVNCDIAVAPQGDNSFSWARAIATGTTNSIVVERNFFRMTTGTLNEQIYHQEGARSTVRFNIFDGTANTGAATFFYDSHGNWSNGGGVVDPDAAGALNARGQPINEFYGNTNLAHTASAFLTIRGGSTLVFSNQFSNLSGSAPGFRFSDEESWQTALFSPLRTVWPAVDQITNTFIWSNTRNGVNYGTVSLINANDATFISQNRDYWAEAPNSTNGSPTGIYDGYVPLTFPHPLAGTPTISLIADQSIMQDTSTAAIAFTIDDTEDAEADLVLTKASSNTTLVPTANIVFGGSGASRTVTVTPAAASIGSSTITVTVTDLNGLYASVSFLLDVTSTATTPARTGKFVRRL